MKKFAHYSLYIRRQQIKMQFSYLHFNHSNILSTSVIFRIFHILAGVMTMDVEMQIQELHFYFPTPYIVYNLRGGSVGFRCTQAGTKRFSHTKYIYMGLLGPNQDVLTQKEFVPGGGVQLTQKLEPFWSTDRRLIFC